MNGKGRSDLEHVLTMLFNRLELPVSYRYKAAGGTEEKGGNLVFLLGAGCSRQYGLPSFRELLTYLWEDYFRSPPNKDWSFEVLRDRLDKYWQSQGPEDRKRVLSYYLDRVKGASCPAYLQLARLARQESRYIRAIVNMNFDTLLEDALDALRVPYKVSNSFRVSSRDKLMIYKPHGTIGDLDSEDGLPEILEHARKLLDLAKQGASSENVAEMRKDFDYHVNEHNASKQEAAKSGEAAQRLIQACLRLFEEMALGWSATSSPEALRREVEEALDSLRDLRQGPIRARNELILDIANSDLFSDPIEQQRAQELLTQHDVVSIGYSGVDAKIAAALRAFAPGVDPRDRKLFVVNSSRPDPRLLLVMAERGSQDLLITGDDASFENFMESLDVNLGPWKKGKEISLPEERTSITRELFMTRAEREGLANCLALAMKIRLSMDVAEQSATSLEEHGYTLFTLCLDLARNAGICLSSPEKYVLHCAAFLHDLGYYQGYSRLQARKNPGWTLLLHHGEMTEKLLARMDSLLRKQINPAGGEGGSGQKNESIIPSSYEDINGGHDFFLQVLREVCAGHTRIQPKIQIPDGKIRIREVDAPVRFSLLHALFAAAEELPEEHPFLPTADPVPARSPDTPLAIEDPILEIYLGRKKKEVEYSIERGRVVGKLQPGKAKPSAITRCFLSMAASFVDKFNQVVRDNKGWGMEFIFDPKPQPVDDVEKFRPLVEKALEERFTETLKTVPHGSVAEVTAVLDLATIYTQKPLDQDEPRVDCASRYMESALQWVRERIDRDGPSPHQSLLWNYFPIKHNGPQSALEIFFLRSCEEIILPAWRFFGRNWQDGIESVLMARACLDLGSSWFRGEVVGGLRDLLGEKVIWNQEKGWAYGHDQCILCTSRLLYILSSARRFFPPLKQDWSANNSNEKTLDQTVEGLLRFMLEQPADGEIWWGLGSEQGRESAIRSGDYLAWAARAVMFCLSIDSEIRGKTGEGWLSESCEIDRALVEKLLRQRWDQLLRVQPEELLSERAEEPHSFIFGHIALACLDLQRLGPEMIRLATGGDLEPLKVLNGHLQSLTQEIGKLSHLSKLFLWPAHILADSLEPTEESGIKIAQHCRNCIASPVWIREGLDLGSWGFNVKNTQALVTSLQAFWQYVFRSAESRQRFERIFEAFV